MGLRSWQAVLTSKGQITLPIKIRRKLGLKAGDILEFDETVPYIKAHKPFDKAVMYRAVGRGKNRNPKLTGKQWHEDLRDPVDLP